ncbi:MAG: GNAT family N-acetyltransferase [Pseudomonadota bacterium]
MTTTVRPFRASDAQDFRDLNMAWISAHFGIEDEDIAQLEQVEETILAKGGRVLIAEKGGEAIGTVALIPLGPGLVELVKMSVREDSRGAGAGRLLMNAAIETAREMGATSIWLETNDVLTAAIKLYERAGFDLVSQEDWRATPYCRCNTQMIKRL